MARWCRQQRRCPAAGAAAAGIVLTLAFAPAAAQAPDDLATPSSTSSQLAARNDWGEINFSLYATVRYLNQRLLDETYTDPAGTTVLLDRRDDLQFQKAILYFRGWLGVPEFRYLTYVWTSNPIMGLGAQVVVAGNFTYRFGDRLELGAGISSLPTTRTTRGSFPFWLRQDARTMADEYFRGSYTTGIWAAGDAIPGVHYWAMVGNNLSQLGVDAGRLEMGMQTCSAALSWRTANLTASEPFGDLEYHADLGLGLGGAFTYSREDRQSQPDVDAPENSQLRLSDGQSLFAPGAVAPGVLVNRASYRMAAVDGLVKYRGWSLEAEVFARWLGNFEATGALPPDQLEDQGFQLQASAMLWPRLVMAYAAASKIFGDRGDPWELDLGVNVYPFHNRALRLNAEVIVVDRSPVGNLSAPLIVGADGTVFVVNLELLF